MNKKLKNKNSTHLSKSDVKKANADSFLADSMKDEANADYRLRYHPPDILSFMRHKDLATQSSEEFRPRKGYEHYKKLRIHLDDAKLTDKQLIAVSLVFYGGIQKKRAAKAMSITHQSLEDHIKGALKKIERTLQCG